MISASSPQVPSAMYSPPQHVFVSTYRIVFTAEPQVEKVQSPSVGIVIFHCTSGLWRSVHESSSPHVVLIHVNGASTIQPHGPDSA